MAKAIVLLSGGLDSCVTAAIAKSQGFDLHALSVFYGQRHSREQGAAYAIAQHYRCPLTLLDVKGFGEMVAPGTVLTDKTKEVPSNRTDEEMSTGQAPSYVPGRNTVLFALAQSLAEAVGGDVIFTGINAVDYSGYVDCRPAFVVAWNELAMVSTFRGVGGTPIFVDAPLISLTKEEIVHRGLELDAPLHLTWSCYKGLDRPCGVCDSCIIRARAFEVYGVPDPWFAHNEGAKSGV